MSLIGLPSGRVQWAPPEPLQITGLRRAHAGARGPGTLEALKLGEIIECFFSRGGAPGRGKKGAHRHTALFPNGTRSRLGDHS